MGAHSASRLAPRGTVAPRALVLDHGLSRSALSAARALAAAGWTVGVGAPSPGLAAASRAVACRHHVAPPERGVDTFVADVAAAVLEGGYEVVLPSEDAQALALSLRRAEIPARVPYGPHAGVLAAFDKGRLADAAVAAGLAVPRSWAPEDDALASEQGPFFVKALVHPNLSRTDAPAHLDPARAATAEEAREHAGQIAAAGGRAVVQELVEGALTAYSLVVDADGGVVAEAQQRATAIWPSSGGISVRAHTVAVDRVLADRVLRLLEQLEWLGLAEAQFIAPADGEPRLIDLNGRLYGSIALAVAAGANLPAAWAAVATGARATDRLSARPGVRYHWLEGDLRLALASGIEAPAALVRALRWAPGATHSVWQLRDPRPATRYLGVFARRALRRATHTR